MHPTIRLKKIAETWRDILVNSVEIMNFCLNRYGKEPTIFVGINEMRLPDERHCPAVYILPGTKTEGLDQSELTYEIDIFWVIEQYNVLVDGEIIQWNEDLTGKLIEFIGVYETDDFGQLIYETLQNTLVDTFPISVVEYIIESQEVWPQYPGFMSLTTKIYPAIGEELEY